MTEKEYIDKEFVMNAINEFKAKPLPKTIVLEHLQQIIKDISAVEVAEVVRCKDCKHLEISGCYGECGKGYLGIVRPDCYCCYGEKRER